MAKVYGTDHIFGGLAILFDIPRTKKSSDGANFFADFLFIPIEMTIQKMTILKSLNKHVFDNPY